jgi:hypothetical protein
VVLSETLDDLVEREGLYYKKFSDVPFSGKITGIIQSSFKNGKKEGAWISCHGNGQLFFKGVHKDGKIEGANLNYHENGQVI